MQKIIDKYDVKSDEIKTTINVISEEGKSLTYYLHLPEIEPATLALLDEIKSLLVTEVNVNVSEIMDPKIIISLKTRFSDKAKELLKEKLPHLSSDLTTYLIGHLLQEMLGLGNIEYLLNDPNLEEIVITSSKEPVRVYHKRYGWLVTTIFVESESQIHNYSNIIARRVGRQVSTLTPLLDAHLITGDRANAVLFPVSTKGNTITIRKFAREPWTVIDFIQNKTCSSEVFAMLWLAIQYEMNVLISGGTASGKTSLLNLCTVFIPPNHRILSIEDTRELQLPKHLYWCPLVTRQPNPEGKGEVSMLDLLINSLRMRPDRIILGEMRKKEQAEVLFEAMHTGHSVYATVHADSMNETIKRLVNPPIEVPSNLLSAVNLNVVMFRDRRRGIRRVYQVGEFLSEEETERTVIKPNIMYRWKPETDKIVAHSESLRLYEDLSRHTGMSEKEITDQIAEKKKILDNMAKKNMRSIREVGGAMEKYYINRESLRRQISRKATSKEIKEKR